MIINPALENKDFREFYPCCAGMEECDPLKSFGPSIRDHYLIHFVKKGSGIFENPAGTREVVAGQAFVIRPGEMCTYTTNKDNPWTYLWVGFRGELAKKFDSCPDVFEYDEQLYEIINYAMSMDTAKEEYLTGLLFMMYAKLFGSRIKNDYSNKVTGYIDANYMHDIKISQIADNLNVNRKYLARIFKEKMGITMQEYLINKRMSEAKKLLRAGYNVEEAAYMTGYSDSFAFSKIFKKTYGKPPLSYKTKN